VSFADVMEQHGARRDAVIGPKRRDGDCSVVGVSLIGHGERPEERPLDLA
jgi:hypothetical protein